jgi:hypothetical protein
MTHKAFAGMGQAVYPDSSIKNVLPQKAGLPTEEENPRWLGAGERVSPVPMRWSIGSTGKQNLPWCV